MAKMKVTCEWLNLGGVLYPKDSVVEVDGDGAEELSKDGNAESAPDSTPVSVGFPQRLDSVEREIREKNFEELKKSGALQAPANAGKVPPAQAGMQAGMAGAESTAGVKIEEI